jgi:TolB-like protein/tetratricopeptide (TPR) repeat protein
MLTGEAPYTGPSHQAIVTKRLMDPVPSARRLRETVPLTVDQAIQRVLAKTPADRYPTAAAFIEALKAPTQATETSSRTTPQHRRKGMLKSSLIAATVLLVGALVLATQGRLDGFRELRTARNTVASLDTGPPRLAVLPFENRGTPEQDYFADGITDEVRGKLSGLPALKVISRTSSAEYKHSPKQPVEIGRELGVHYLLTATVRWDKGAQGDRVRVSPELIDARDASTKWQAPFDAAMTDVFVVQGQIASQVAQALNVVLGASERQALAARPTQNLAAYDAFMKGEAISGSLTRLEPITLRRALEYYKQAVELDSAFVQAWLQVTRSHSISYAMGYDPTPARKEATRRAAERVTQLSPDGYESPWARAAYAADVLRDLKQGAKEIAEALRRFPTQPDLLRYAANYESMFGDNDAALAHLRQAALLDPRSISVAMSLVGTLEAMGRRQEALAESERALAIDPVNLDARGQAMFLRLNAGDLAGAQRLVRDAPAQLDTAFAVWLASGDLAWVMDDARQRLVLGLQPAAFDNDRTTWGGALAMLYRLRGDSVRSQAYADSSRVEQARLVAGDPENADQRQHLAMQLALAGRKTEALTEVDRVRAIAGKFQDSVYIHARLAHIYLVLGETDKALDELEFTAPRGYPQRGWLRIDPRYASLRGNSRFERLAQGDEGSGQD